MIPKEFEQSGLELPVISPKTSVGQLQEFAKKRWLSDARRTVARDVVNNGKELLVGENIDWNLVLRNIREEQMGSLYHEEKAIAINSARTIGRIGASADWSMHDPAIVYLSGKCIADKVGGGKELGDFESTMRRSISNYGQKILAPDADLYMSTLDFLLARHKKVNLHATNRIMSLLGERNIEAAYEIVKRFRGD